MSLRIPKIPRTRITTESTNPPATKAARQRLLQRAAANRCRPTRPAPRWWTRPGSAVRLSPDQRHQAAGSPPQHGSPSGVQYGVPSGVQYGVPSGSVQGGALKSTSAASSPPATAAPAMSSPGHPPTDTWRPCAATQACTTGGPVAIGTAISPAARASAATRFLRVFIRSPDFFTLFGIAICCPLKAPLAVFAHPGELAAFISRRLTVNRCQPSRLKKRGSATYPSERRHPKRNPLVI